VLDDRVEPEFLIQPNPDAAAPLFRAQDVVLFEGIGRGSEARGVNSIGAMVSTMIPPGFCRMAKMTR